MLCRGGYVYVDYLSLNTKYCQERLNLKTVSHINPQRTDCAYTKSLQVLRDVRLTELRTYVLFFLYVLEFQQSTLHMILELFLLGFCLYLRNCKYSGKGSPTHRTCFYYKQKEYIMYDVYTTYLYKLCVIHSVQNASVTLWLVCCCSDIVHTYVIGKVFVFTMACIL